MEAKGFWEKVKKLTAMKGRTFVWLCEKAGVSVQIMKNRIYKERFPDVNDTIKILSILGITIEEFFNVEKLFPVKTSQISAVGDDKIPVSDHFSLDGFEVSVSADSTEETPEYVSIPQELKKSRYKGHLGAANIRGDSMEPAIHNGDLIIYDDLGFEEDGIYAVIYQKKSIVKRIQMIQGGIKILSDNPAYAPITIPCESEEVFRIIGKVHYTMHRL